MSTQTSKILITEEDFNLHLYHEMHDNLYHLDLSDKSNSFINVIIPEHMVEKLIKYVREMK